MTDGEALALITSSAPFKKANGNFRGAWLEYARLNPRGADWLLNYAAGELGQPVPVGVTDTLYGRGMRHFVLVEKFALVPTTTAVAPPPVVVPKPEPPRFPASTRNPVTGAICIEAGAMHDCENSNSGLEKAGVRHVCFQIWPIDESVIRNHKAFREQGTLNWFRSRGFKVGGFTVNYFQPEDEAKNTAEQLDAWDLDFLVADIEHHKADMPGGNMDLTEELCEGLRALLGQNYPVWMVGYGQNSAPSVVNHAAMDEYGIDYIDECYNENGYSDGVVAGVQKITRENRVPADVALGNKSLANDAGHVHLLRSTAGSRLRDVWLWRPESGEAQTDLIAGVDLVP